MATEAARLKRKNPLGGKRKTDLTLTGLLMEGLSRSHLDSAVELGSSDRNSLGHFPHRFLAIAQWFVHPVSYTHLTLPTILRV